MTRDEVDDLVMGVAVVALAYALYKHFKPADKAKPSKVAAAPVATKAPGLVPFSSVSLDELLYGAAHDVGAFEGKNYLALMEAPSVEWWKK